MVALLGLGATSGAALAFFGIAQQLRWQGKLYWMIPLGEGASPFASYVNRNHAASYLNLTLACAVGFAIWAFSRKASKRKSESTTSDVLGSQSTDSESNTWIRHCMPRLGQPGWNPIVREPLHSSRPNPGRFQ
jgi:hypothetical protein